MLRDTVNNKFIIRPLFPKEIEGQEQLDSLATKFRNLPFYRDILYNDTAQTFLLAITVNKDKMRNSQRENLIRSVRRIGNTFEKESNLKLHYSGLPYIRVVTSMNIKKEIYFFSILALFVCIVFLYIFSTLSRR